MPRSAVREASLKAARAAAEQRAGRVGIVDLAGGAGRGEAPVEVGQGVEGVADGEEVVAGDVSEVWMR